MVIIAAGAVRVRSACRLKAAACGTAKERAEQRCLKSSDPLMAEAVAQVILLRRDAVIELQVVAVGVFAERQVR